MDETIKNSPCKECTEGDELQLHIEVEHLRRHLSERDTHILTLESECIKSDAKARGLEEQLSVWQEKYDRLYDSHKRVQKLNQILEDKLLQMVDKMKNEKSQLTKDIATLSVRLAESKHNCSMLQKENERYKNDMNLAIQLLQCKPDNFVSQKLDNLPVDTQTRVSQYVMSKSKPGPPSSTSKNDTETFDASEYEFNISASLMSKILEDSIQDTVTKHCDTCTCSKTTNKPFCYNESYYSVSTQTTPLGDGNFLCANCNSHIRSMNSNLAVMNASPHSVKVTSDVSYTNMQPLYVMPQVINDVSNENETINVAKPIIPSNMNLEVLKFDDKPKKPNLDHEVSINLDENLKSTRISNGMNMEPSVHHKLCDRTKTPISSKKSNSIIDDNLIKDVAHVRSNKGSVDYPMLDNISLRKNSQSSMGAVSRTSSIAKSTSSTHKSNTQVGPGPRFCSLRMQAGSKNILLDNAQPDVPPILYRRQSKCNETSVFKVFTEGVDNFMEKKISLENENDFKNDNVVVESTLIDVHVDNNTKESNAIVKHTPINPALLNVSSSPLQPLKTHSYSNGIESNNNQTSSVTSQINTIEVDNLLDDFSLITSDNKNNDVEGNFIPTDTSDNVTPLENKDVKIFNFDRYEQKKLSSQYVRPLRKIEMSNLHSLENTKISKDLPPQGDIPNMPNKDLNSKVNVPTVVNVYPNLTQTHLKVNDAKKAFNNEHSTSSLSSDDSAAILQKQQLLRVAAWVEQNLEQHNNFNDPLVTDDEASFKLRENKKLPRRDSKSSRITDTLNELAISMPHPVSKLSNTFNHEDSKNWVHTKIDKPVLNSKPTCSKPNVVLLSKETIFPVDCVSEDVDDETKIRLDKEANDCTNDADELGNNINEVINGVKNITAEELARMEYNVKKFLLSGPQWVNPEAMGRSRRTSSKTETDV